MSTHKITALRTGHTNGMDWEAEYEITLSFTPGAAPIRAKIEMEICASRITAKTTGVKRDERI